MGWTFIKNATREDVIDEIVRGNESFWTIHHCVKHGTMYALHGSSKSDGHPFKWIGVHLIQNDPGYGWGYKSMDESMGSYEFDCPIHYLDEADEPINKSAADWRDRVRREHTRHGSGVK